MSEAHMTSLFSLWHCRCRLSGRHLVRTVDGYYRCAGCKLLYDARGDIVDSHGVANTETTVQHKKAVR